jgi:peptidoglycan/LPS O-acetylase OafA/YrhL
LKIEHSDWLVSKWLGLFPGVPVFFFISGFLISKSFENNSALMQYARNRALRLFPGLIVCGVVSLISIVLSGYLSTVDVDMKSLVLWILAQITFFQFYDPDFLAGYGIGQSNGSLWTVFVEIQFYVLVPGIYWLFARAGKTAGRVNAMLLLAIVVFLLIHRYFYYYPETGSFVALTKRILKVSFAPYFYMFLIGVLFQKNFDIANRYLSGRFVWVLVVYIGVSMVLRETLSVDFGNKINPLLYLPLCFVVFAGAFSYRETSNRLLNGNDISYGIYIYHMVVVNLFIYLGLVHDAIYLALAALITVVLAILSWLFVEKPGMRRKAHPLHSVATRS